MNWKIARIEISSFKAFKHIDLDLSSSSLLTLDGPNGYGKTTIFDAIELLLTGKIKRIENLFATLMTKQKKNYDDNLFWNNRSRNQDLTIKVEFDNGPRKLILARHAPVKAFKTKTNNRADEFKLFSLYELPEFDSDDFSPANIRENEFLDEVFGENFRENFPFLNYLEQGQNKLLHTRVDERKDELGNLFNISDIATEIENCRSISTKLSRFLSDEKRKTDESSLQAEYAALREMIGADFASAKYKRLSTIDSELGWDKKEPFPIYDQESYDQYIEAIRGLDELLTRKSVVRIRADNEEIEAEINRTKELLTRLAKLGTDRSRLEELNKTKNKLNRLTAALAVIKQGAANITTEQASELPGWKNEQFNQFKAQITERNSLQSKNVKNEVAATELARLKKQILEEHAKIYPDDTLCPLCGNDWKAHKSMLEAVEKRAEDISNSLGEDGQALIKLVDKMTIQLDSLETFIKARETDLKRQYDEALHKVLHENRTHLTAIDQLAERLNAKGIPVTFSFSEDEVVVDSRLKKLLDLIRSKKKEDSGGLPDNWREIIFSAFKELQDFYMLDHQDIKNKELYIKFKANEARSNRLQQCQANLKKIQQENEAANLAKEKVNKLRTTLKKAEQKYADQTISEVELIFHIYSGRLIQNYQRGLGLFIESQDGKQLRFLTAEKSDHDAVLSMSTGQVSALGLAFFLSLNKVYANVPLMFIDDPSQSLDEVNIASLTDLLRCELKRCQLIVSSHEDDISAYMRYRFSRAGLKSRSLNMQQLAKEAP